MSYPQRHSDAVVTATLALTRGNISAAARRLGQVPKTLWTRLKRNPALWPEGAVRLAPGGLPGAMRRKTAG